MSRMQRNVFVNALLNDECQYAVSELMEYLETFLNGEEGY